MEEIKLKELADERLRRLKEMELLQKQYEFYNQFCFDNSLGEEIAHLIKEIEGNDCVCQKIICEIPEHFEEVKRRLPGEKRKRIVEKHYNKKFYVYIAIINSCIAFDKYQFKSIKEMKDFLSNICLAYTDYFGILYPDKLCARFPYLKGFFYYINQWRIETGRVTVDNDLIKAASASVLESENISQFKAR